MPAIAPKYPRTPSIRAREKRARKEYTYGSGATTIAYDVVERSYGKVIEDVEILVSQGIGMPLVKAKLDNKDELYYLAEVAAKSVGYKLVVDKDLDPYDI